MTQECLEILRRRILPEGGFAESVPPSGFRPDSTAWAVLAFFVAEAGEDAVARGRHRLAEAQLPDGRVPISPDDPQSFWPTSLAILAWTGDSAYRESQQKAIQFLRKTTGLHWQKEPDSPFGHDTFLAGWPWVELTHSWVEPTALSIIAVTTNGSAGEPRVRQAVNLLLDRQLADGGWNYGNTRVFGQELRPLAYSTGMALSALEGKVEAARVEKSLLYLEQEARRIRTPLSLSWAILGLAAWGRQPASTNRWLEECWAKQETFDQYQTTLVSLLLLARHCPEGLSRKLQWITRELG